MTDGRVASQLGAAAARRHRATGAGDAGRRRRRQRSRRLADRARRHRADSSRRQTASAWWCCRRRRRAACCANVGELLSLPGTLVLIAVTAIAALVIFAPARNRLRALEQAAERFGAGELDARAPGAGPRRDRARGRRVQSHGRGPGSSGPKRCRLSDRLRRQMLADISHELRTPLTTMRGYLDTLDMPEIVARRGQARGAISTPSRGETLRLERIVTDLLELARFENGVAASRRASSPSSACSPAVARRYERDAAAASVTIRTRVARRPISSSADPDRLDQAIEQSRRQRAAAHAAGRHHRSRGDGERTSGYRADGDRFGHGIAPDTCRTCSSGSTKSIIARTSGPAAAALACRSSRRSSSATAARSP